MIKAVKISAIASGFENKEKDEVCEAEGNIFRMMKLFGMLL